MAQKLACVIYLSSYSGSVAATEEKLVEQGFAVHVFEIAKALASQVSIGQWDTLPAEIADCVKKADLVVLLIEDDAELLGPIAGLSSDAGCQVVTVGGEPDALPDGLDDIIDGHLPNLEIPQAEEILGGATNRLGQDGDPVAPRKPRRVKCQ